ncbi:hypothetical protein ACOJUY_004343 [Vibrio alginolyticus]
MSTLTVTHIDAALVDPRIFELCESFLINEFKTAHGPQPASHSFLNKKARAYAQSVLTPMLPCERHLIPTSLDDECKILAQLRAKPRDEAALIRAYHYAKVALSTSTA